ncbi:BLUF domain-containing protein [Methylomonas sp. LL1]|uniref:BLUF domain-containing protein n=1 Tax=Methylomonas sp. LL1 TaxID=2785785 RepID=UPI0018C3EC0D|nr:BLUF domain-containing protein [Methylomonas sp. LL1]QPK63543.1 BLUF domain-containing protein [Methylomonas sp. LL1]
MSLYCVVYTSVASQKWSDDDLRELLKRARAKNERLNVTGMLLYLDPFSLQVLEGEETVLDQLFNTIKQDARHYKVSVIYKKPISERSFGDWTMGFNKISDQTPDVQEGFNDFLQRPMAELPNLSSEVDDLLRLFRHEILF